ncbi:MAG: TolC family protein [Bacteroidota bacterium]
MKRLIFILSISILIGQWGWAQETLSLEDAIVTALENNYGVQIAKYNTEQAEIQSHPGAAGLYPSFNLSGGGNYNLTNRTTVSGNPANPILDPEGNPIEEFVFNESITTYGLNTAVGVAYAFGLGQLESFKILQTNASLTKENGLLVMEQTIAQISSTYYQLARLTKAYQLQEASLKRSRQRLEFAQTQREFGTGTELAVLNARVDVSTDSINLLNANLNIENARKDLNFLMGTEIDRRYEVNTELELNPDLNMDELETSALSSNTSLKVADYGRKVAELNLRVAQRARYPSVNVSGNYAYNYSTNFPFAQTLDQATFGFAGNGSISIPIFQGNQLSRNIQNAEVGIASSRSQYKQTEQQVIRDLQKSYATYINNLGILRLSETSVAAAQANFNRTKEAFELGQSTNIAFREAQLNLLRAENQLNNVKFDVKSSEIDLLRLSGRLVADQ